MRAVIILVHRVVVIGEEVPAVRIIHETVAIVINAIADDLIRIPLHVRHQVGMRAVHARVDHAHQHLA